MRRLWLVFIIFCICFGAIILRLFYWQIVRGHDLRRQAAAQYSKKVFIAPSRGEIRTSDGYVLATNQPVSLVYAMPAVINNPLLVSQKLSEVLGLNQAELSTQLVDGKKQWVLIARKVESAQTDALKSLEVKGLGFEREYKRYYPESSMAAHLLGFVGFDQNGNDKGYFGLEGYYDRELRGKAGEVIAEWDPNGAPILVGGVNRIDAQNGRTLTLWLDRSIQYLAETHLKEGLVKYGAVSGSVIVMDPNTGGILAQASYPNYDPRTYQSWEQSLFPNPIVASSFEPGSIFKTIVMAAGIEERVVTPQMTIDERGPIQIGEYAIRTWNNEYHGVITMADVLRYSSNVGMVYVGRQLGKDKLLKRIRSFGFGERTGVDLEEESSPPIRNESDYTEIDLAALTFGQGIAVTPLQMVRAVSAIANGGWLVEPRVVKSFTDESGKEVPVVTKRTRQVISEKTARQVTEMLVYTVDNGEAKWARPKGYRIAGKTGTAQIAIGGKYDKEKTVASFIGFAPADNAKFLVLVTLREPKSSPWGSETAAPLFFRITKDIIKYYGIVAER